MKAYGYKKDDEELIELQEVSLQCSLEELDKIIEFLINVKKIHSSVSGETKLCHSHLRDWDKDWNNGEMDFIVVTNFRKI